MANITKKQIGDIADILRAGGGGVLPTDTIYGIVGSALNKKTVEKIYQLRKRNPKKPVIILIPSAEELRSFGIRPSAGTKKMLAKWWPGKVSVVLDLPTSVRPRLKYLHRGTNTLAFRVPKLAWLRTLLEQTGPLVAPSANFEGMPPALTIKEARAYFKKDVAFYLDAGRRESKPSTLVTFEKGRPKVLRAGAVKI